MQAAKLLVRSEIPFSFVEPSGKIGHDYEARIDLPSGNVACCEVKAKSDETSLSDRTILNSLKKAGGQASKDEPLIVVIKLPDHWISDSGLKAAVDAATTKFFQDYGRAIAVVYFWEEWQELESGPLVHLWKFNEFINTTSRFHDSTDAHLIRTWGMKLTPGSWINFPDLAADFDGNFGGK